MKKMIVVAAVVFMFTGCSTMTSARYSVSIDNNQALKRYAGTAVKVASITAEGSYGANCRLMGPIEAADGVTIPQFVEKAFNDEFKFANIYSDSGVTLNGSLTRIEFSSTSGITKGVWDLTLKLTSSNGKSMSVANSYGFQSGFDAGTACHQAAQALVPAVQDLIKRFVTDIQFGSLIR